MNVVVRFAFGTVNATARRITLFGSRDFCVHKSIDLAPGFVVTHAPSGLMVAAGKNAESAIEAAKLRFEDEAKKRGTTAKNLMDKTLLEWRVKPDAVIRRAEGKA